MTINELSKKYYFVSLILFQVLFLECNLKFRCRNEFGMTLFGQPQDSGCQINKMSCKY